MITRDEVVKKIAREGYISIEHAEELYDSIVPKSVVPQFVAEWIEYCKSNKLTLLGAFDPVSEHGIGLADTFTEVWKGTDWAKRNQETFARAWLDGYEVEGEKKYTVRIRNLDDEETYLNYDNFRETWVFYSREDTDRFRTTHTKKQLEDGCFGWVFDCEGIEVKEVE